MNINKQDLPGRKCENTSKKKYHDVDTVYCKTVLGLKKNAIKFSVSLSSVIQ